MDAQSTQRRRSSISPRSLTVMEKSTSCLACETSDSANSTRLWLRAHCQFDIEKAMFSLSTNGTTFQELGNEFRMVFQLKTFQGVRYALFHYNTTGAPCSCADFDQFTVDELRSGGLTKPIPIGEVITICSLGDGSVLAVKNATLITVPAGDPSASSPTRAIPGGGAGCWAGSRCNLNPAAASFLFRLGAVRVKSRSSPANPATTSRFNGRACNVATSCCSPWPHTATSRLTRTTPARVSANHPGPRPDRKDRSCFSGKTEAK
jgi:xylan 1,4-beta-xylosidase